ncbi:hypothetical protein AAF712_002732 [Marasmius tenuissimus]|uniref:INO80 complex subunit B-like conserved region domain-containing protein n=1 Tax=Marasmius tenuissimus TaxID=585030 RepID=A0ABR3A9P3_9AGAR|nr:hypothetical protein PM082_006023 [Marasmius tenuissimus]
MQLRRRTNKPSLREISDDDEGEEEVEEEEEEAEGDEEDVEEDGDAEPDVDVEDEDAEQDVEGEEDEEDAQIDVEGEEEDMDEDGSSTAQPRLKIKLKLPVVASSTSNSATPVPEETRTRAAASTSKRSAAVRSRRRIQDMDSSEDDEDDEATGPSRSTRPMTTRQAVLANVVDSSHVSLDADMSLDTPDHKPNPRKKQLNETELALRREETARKRKNLSEKKLEDEKLETINRLLRKQSKPRAKKGTGTASGGVTPVRGGKRGGARGTRGGRAGRSGLGTAKASTAGSEAGDEEGANDNEGEGNDEEGAEAEDEEVEDGDQASGSGSGLVEEIPLVPMFRWISSSRVQELKKEEAPNGMEVDSETAPDKAEENHDMNVDTEQPSAPSEPKMTLSFSIPPAFLSETSSLAQAPVAPPPPRGPQVCAVAECSSPRKYRLVSDWTIGACGMGHLKLLETQVQTKAGIA